MTIVNMNTFGWALKTLYPKGVKYAVQQDMPFLALVDKDTEFYGEDKKIAVIHGTGAGRASSMSTARSGSTAHRGKRFSLERVKDYAVGYIDRETMLASEKDKGAIVKAYATEMKSKILLIKKSLALGVTGDGSGAFGRLDGNPSGGVITLRNAEDVINVEVDMILQANPNKTGNSGTIRAGTGTVTAVDRDAGTITYTATGGWSPVDGDYLYAQGDYDAKITGVQAWIPETAPGGSDSFLGVNRSVDPTRLAGIRVTDTADAGDHVEAMIEGLVTMGRHEANPDVAFTSFHDWKILQTLLIARGELQLGRITNELGIGFRAIVFAHPRGECKVVADPYFPRGWAFPLRMEDWTLDSLKECPHVIQDDGLELVRGTDDDFSFELAYYANLECENPGGSGRIQLPTV
jgi:hypothetical protein